MDWESHPEPFEPSVLKDPGEEEAVASQARVLDISAYRDSTERIIPDYGEANYQSELDELLFFVKSDEGRIWICIVHVLLKLLVSE